MSDLRIALRGLRRAPTFTVTAVLTLGVGIGMAVAMLTVFDAVLLRPLPMRDEGDLVAPRAFDRSGVDVALWPEELDQLSHDSRALREVAGVVHWAPSPHPFLDGDRTIVLDRSIVTGNFFELLGARPALGRLLRADDDVAGAAPAMVLSYGAWQREFGGDTGIVGRDLTDPYTQFQYRVVGVAPPGLDYPTGAEFWIALRPLGRALMDVVARLAPGIPAVAARSDFLSLARRLDAQRPVPAHIAAAQMRPFGQTVLGDVRPLLVGLAAAVALLLVIACVNVGNLLLVRATTRSREIAIRRALGAGSGDLVGRIVAECALLALAGGALGVLTAGALLRLLIAVAPPELPRMDVVRLAGVPLAAAAAVTLVALLLFGVPSALAAARADSATPLRLDSRAGSGGKTHNRVRQWLVASQLALAVITLAGAGLLVRSLGRLESLRLGYDPHDLAILHVSIPPALSGSHFTLGEDLTERLGAMPGVAAITPILIPPFEGPNVFLAAIALEGTTSPSAAANPVVPYEVGGTGYFRTFGIPLLRGRGFRDTDQGGAPKVLVVSESTAGRFWPGEDPLGKRLRILGEPQLAGWWTVVGVAGDTRLRDLRDVTPAIYFPWRQYIFWQGLFAARTSGPVAAVIPAMRRAVRETDARLTLWRAQPMSAYLAGPLARPRLSAMLFSAFAIVALLLAAIGLYGVVASAVRAQTRVIGIRTALGATPQTLRREVLRQALAVAGTGALAGAIGALVTTRALRSLLFEVSPADPIALLGACGVLIVVALIAADVPARRAAKVDPMVALRYE